MKKLICLIAVLSLLASSQVLAFDEYKFTSLLKKFNKTAIPVTANMGKTDPYDKPSSSGFKGGQQNPSQNPSDEDVIWLRAEEINKQIEFMIQGIETAKGVATALAIIINLCENGQISVEVALSAVQILKLRAVFMKVFISNGQSDLEVMVNILQEHENELSKQVQAKTTVGVNGRIRQVTGQ